MWSQVPSFKIRVLSRQQKKSVIPSLINSTTLSKSNISSRALNELKGLIVVVHICIVLAKGLVSFHLLPHNHCFRNWSHHKILTFKIIMRFSSHVSLMHLHSHRLIMLCIEKKDKWKIVGWQGVGLLFLRKPYVGEPRNQLVTRKSISLVDFIKALMDPWVLVIYFFRHEEPKA